MANYPPSAPFFGMPPYPPAFPPQSAPPPPAGGSGYQNVPPLPPPPPPSQQQQQQHPSQQAQAHNASGFGHNTSLPQVPQVPQVDFQALGLNPGQLAALWQQVQNGAVPPPLPFPPLFTSQSGFAPPPPPPIPFPTGFQPPATPTFPVPPPQALPGFTAMLQPPGPAASLIAPNNRVMEIINGDKEEGELSDEPGSQDEPERSRSRGDNHRSGRGNERYGYCIPSNGTKPNSPQWQDQRAKPSSIHLPQERMLPDDRTDTLQSSAGQMSSDSKDLAWSRSTNPAAKHPTLDLAGFEERRRQAETFLTVLHSCGYGYVDLQKSGLDPKLVKEIWTSLGFPIDPKPLGNATRPPTAESKVVPPDPSPPNNLPTTLSVAPPAATTASAQLPPKPQPPAGTAATNKTNGGAATVSPTDRAAYIARLMAAKNSKAATKTTATSPATPSPAPASTAVAPAPPQAERNSSADADVLKQGDPPVTDPAVLAAQKKEAQNELLRKKIEALKIPKKKAEEEARAKAQAVAASLSANRTPSTSSAGTATPTKSEIPVRPAQLPTAVAAAAPSKDAPHPSVPLQSPGGIPGLFMTAPTAPRVPQSAQQSPPLSGNKGRKRPVAADFDDLQQSRTPSAFKRPFGQSQNDHEQMIIEVSDDETVGSVMDIDEADDLQPSAQQSSQPLPKVGAHRNMPSLTNFPPRPNFSRQGSAQSTPPAASTPISAAKIEDLRRKEEEIAALKKKLAEKERQRLARAQSSRAQTPATPTNQPSLAPQQVASPSSTVPINKNASTQPTPAIRTGVSSSATLTSSPHSPAEPEWKRRRRAEIQSGISAFDADLNSNMSRLEQLRREMEQIEAENQRRQQEKETLINELENLGIDTEGMPHEELQAKKEEIMQQQEAAAAAELEASMNAADSAPLDEPTSNPKTTSEEQNQDEAPLECKAPSESSGDQMSMSDDESGDESDTTEAEMDMSESDAEKDEPAHIQTAGNTVDTSTAPLPAEQPQEILHEESPSKQTHAVDTSEQEDTEDFYSPDPQTEVSKDPEAVAKSAPQGSEVNAQGSAEEEENDYTPPELLEQQSSTSENAHPIAVQSELEGLGDESDMLESRAGSTSAGHTPEDVTERSIEPPRPDPAEQEITNDQQANDASSEATDEGDDDYDPSQMLPEQSRSTSASEHPTPQTTSTENITGLSAPQSIEASQASADGASESMKSRSETPSHTPQVAIISDHVVSELQGRSLEGSRSDQNVLDTSDLKPRSFYSPYESPLRKFKAYRYHPQYSQSVSGGYRSLTFSHEIDPMKPVCPFETAGGICNDNACEGQHFRAMGISEDKILVQLGIANPGRTPEEQERWRTGLKQVLKDLRERNVKDAESVAAAITNYRREFLQDPSKVLNV